MLATSGNVQVKYAQQERPSYLQIEASRVPFSKISSEKLDTPMRMTSEPSTTTAGGGDDDSCSSNSAGSSQRDSNTARNSVMAYTSSDLTDATIDQSDSHLSNITANLLDPETNARTAPVQVGSLVGSDFKGLGSASEHDSEPSACNTSGYESCETSSSKNSSKEEASDTCGVAVGGPKGVQGSSGGAGGGAGINQSETQPQSGNVEADGAGNSSGKDGNSGGEEQKKKDDADKNLKDNGRHNAAKDAKKKDVYLVHVESETLHFTSDLGNDRHCQVGRSLEWSSK